MKKFLCFSIVFFIVIYICLSIYSLNKMDDIKYAVEKYSTTGVFNKYKLYKLHQWEIEFSDGNMCIVSVKGLSKKSPHDLLSYKIFLEKNKKGLWKLKKYYPNP